MRHHHNILACRGRGAAEAWQVRHGATQATDSQRQCGGGTTAAAPGAGLLGSPAAAAAASCCCCRCCSPSCRLRPVPASCCRCCMSAPTAVSAAASYCACCAIAAAARLRQLPRCQRRVLPRRRRPWLERHGRRSTAPRARIPHSTNDRRSNSRASPAHSPHTHARSPTSQIIHTDPGINAPLNFFSSSRTRPSHQASQSINQSKQPAPI